jgi:hypothetical protein
LFKTYPIEPICSVSPVNRAGSFVEVSFTSVIEMLHASLAIPGVCKKQIAKSPIENGFSS